MTRKLSSLLPVLCLLLSFAGHSQAQVGTQAADYRVGTTDRSGSCLVSEEGFIVVNTTDGKWFECTSGSWVENTGTPPTSGGGGTSNSSTGPTCFKPQTVNYNQSTLAGTTGLTASVSLTNLAFPAEYKVTSVSIQPVTPFVASGMTALSVSLGGNGNNTAYSIACQTGSTCNPTAAASNTNMLDDGGSFSVTKAAHTPYLYFSSTGANLNTLTAGSINVFVCGVTLPTTTQVVP